MPTTSTSQVDKTRSKFLKHPPDLSSFKTFAGAFFAVAGRCRWHPLPGMTKTHLNFSKHPPDLSGFKTFAGAFFAAAVKRRWHPPHMDSPSFTWKFSKDPPDLSGFKTFAGAFFVAAVKRRWHPPHGLTHAAKPYYGLAAWVAWAGCGSLRAALN